MGFRWSRKHHNRSHTSPFKAGLAVGVLLLVFGSGFIWTARASQERMAHTLATGEKITVIPTGWDKGSNSAGTKRSRRGGHSRYYVKARRVGLPESASSESFQVSKRFYHSVRLGEPYDVLQPSRADDPSVFLADTDRHKPAKEVLIMGWVIAGLGIGVIALGAGAELRGH